jgi:flavin-dependent dehydrogenase
LAGWGGRVLFAGDAAGACDPMTGEGIAQALETGGAAARAIAQNGPRRPEQAAARYARVVRWSLAVDDLLSRQLASVLAHHGGSGRALALVDTSAWGRRYFARWMFEDYPRAVLATPHRWRRKLFTRPGAYVRSTHTAGSGPDRGTTVDLHD